MIELKNIDKAFNPHTVNEVQVFEDYNLQVPDGQFMSIIGSNGSGKTTLLNLLCGALHPDEGQIIFDGKDVTKAEEHQRFVNIGRVYQDPAMGTAPQLTLLENLALADNKNKSWNLSRAVDPDRRDYYASRLERLGLGLENKLDDQVGAFSGGQRQSIALLMATLQPIDYLLLDEHTAALDPKTADGVMELTLQLISERSLTALMVTHNLSYAVDYGDRLYMMHKGQAVIDKQGQEKKNLSLNDILDTFYSISIEAGNSL